MAGRSTAAFLQSAFTDRIVSWFCIQRYQQGGRLNRGPNWFHIAHRFGIVHLPIRYPNLGANPPSQPLPPHHAVNQHMMHGNEGERTVHQGQGEAKGGLPGRLTIRALLLTHLARCMSILSILVHRACPEAKSGSLFFSRSSQNCGLRFDPTLSVRSGSVI